MNINDIVNLINFIQKELLEHELKTWMKGYEQTDDILVMGVRI
jgi:hypothetical protein